MVPHGGARICRCARRLTASARYSAAGLAPGSCGWWWWWACGVIAGVTVWNAAAYEIVGRTEGTAKVPAELLRPRSRVTHSQAALGNTGSCSTARSGKASHPYR